MIFYRRCWNSSKKVLDFKEGTRGMENIVGDLKEEHQKSKKA